MLQVFLIVSILAGQLIKLPLFGVQGPTLLDSFVLFVSIFGTIKLKFRLRKPNLTVKLGLLFSAVTTLSLILTPLHLKSEEYIISFSYTVRFLLYLYLGWIIYSGAFSQFRKQISRTLLISGVDLAVLGLLQLIFIPDLRFLEKFGWDPHYFRTVSTFLDPNFAGAFFVLTILLLMSLRAQRSNLVQNILLARLPRDVPNGTSLAMTVVYLALLTTFSRSSYLMFLFSGLTFSFLKKSKALFFLTLMLFILLLLGFQAYSQLVAQPKGINRNQSASYRIGAWQDGISIFQKSPLLGVGFNAYKYAIREYHLSDQQFLESRGSSTNDSSLLYVLATTGVLGLITYILFLISIIKSAFKNNFMLVAAMAGLILHSFFANSLFYPFILIWIFLKVIDTKD